MKKRVPVLLLVLLLLLLAFGCDDEPVEITQVANPHFPENTEAGEGSWAIYWYLCGSDLETEGGSASKDLAEMMQVQLPEGVTVVIQTGGANEWHNDFVNPDYSERFTYTSEGLEFVERQRKVNMGDKRTLTDFLKFCTKNYPADNQAVILWDHGSGSVYGLMYDEQFDNASLRLPDVYQAFQDAGAINPEDPPFAFIGFDACLMANIDTAVLLQGAGQYLIASEEVEPALGWDYTGFLQALADNPGMNTAQLGKAICDTYAEACNAKGQAGKLTLSVTDLTKLDPLIQAYNALGNEALVYACEDSGFLSALGRGAKSAEIYGSQSMKSGYTNMVDLGDLARSCDTLLPHTADAVIEALEYCVVYRVQGPYRDKSTGLACFYSYDSFEPEYEIYADMGISEPFVHLYGYAIKGEISQQGLQYASTISLSELNLDFDFEDLDPQPVQTFLTVDLEDYPLTVDDDGNATLTLGPRIADMLTGVYYQLAYVDWDDDFMMLLGRENDINADWEAGIFRDNFRGFWPALDGNFVYLELTYEGDDYTNYDVPILLNSEEYYMSVSYNYTAQAYEILGVHRGTGDDGRTDKLSLLEKGDQITILHYVSSIEGDDDFEAVPLDTITWTGDNIFQEEAVGDAEFVLFFEMVDVQNNSMYSDFAYIEVDGDMIYISVE